MGLKELIPLRELPNHLPTRNGKKVHFSTLYRWATRGCRGRRLHTVRVGGILYTTMGAVEEFNQPNEPDPIEVDDEDLIDRIGMAEAELDAMGIK